jgi:predicted aspartyl protease
MGKVLVTAKIENLVEAYSADQGTLAKDAVRTVEVHDALVGTGATGLSIPKGLIDRLGLFPIRPRRVRTSVGSVDVQTYGAVRLTIQGRDCVCDVMEVPDECPVLIGQVPLELLDFVVDPKNRCLIGNPAHGGQQMMEMY